MDSADKSMASAIQEKVRYVSQEFPIYIRPGNLHRFPSFSYQCHWHDDLEFLWVLSGYMNYNVNGEIVRLETGDGIFVNSRNLHYGFSVDGSDCLYRCLLIPPSLVSVTSYLTQSFVLPLCENRRFPFLLLHPQIDWQREILGRLEEAFRLSEEKNKGYEMEISGCFFSILSVLFGHMPAEAPEDILSARKNRQLALLREMVSFIQTHFADPITAQDIAAAGNICTSKCCYLFKKHLLHSPNEFLLETRLQHSCTLLEKTSLRIIDIAYRSGFSSSSYYSGQFRKLYHCTPTQYRKEKEREREIAKEEKKREKEIEKEEKKREKEIEKEEKKENGSGKENEKGKYA